VHLHNIKGKISQSIERCTCTIKKEKYHSQLKVGGFSKTTSKSVKQKNEQKYLAHKKLNTYINIKTDVMHRNGCSQTTEQQLHCTKRWTALATM
jgi:hypothetical protein